MFRLRCSYFNQMKCTFATRMHLNVTIIYTSRVLSLSSSQTQSFPSVCQEKKPFLSKLWAFASYFTLRWQISVRVHSTISSFLNSSFADVFLKCMENLFLAWWHFHNVLVLRCRMVRVTNISRTLGISWMKHKKLFEQIKCTETYKHIWLSH